MRLRACRISIRLQLQSVVSRLLRCCFFRYEETQILMWGPGHQLLRVSVSLRQTVRSRFVHLLQFVSSHRVAPMPARSAERQDVRQLSSRASLQAPAVVQRNLGGMENAVFRVDQLRTVEEMDGKASVTVCCELSFCDVCACNNVAGVLVDGSSASVRVEQCIQLEGLPLADAYAVRTVTTATPVTQDNARAVDGHVARAITITVEGAVECNDAAIMPGLKGVIEGMLYYQVCRACYRKSLLSALLRECELLTSS